MSSSKLSLKNLDVKGKKVLMRVDFNVPLDSNNHITDDSRIKETLPSIQYVLDHGGSLILMSHLGRPKGSPNPKYSLAPCAKRLSELLGKPVTLAPNCVGEDVDKLVRNLKPGQILMLENMRFHKGEEKPFEDPVLAKLLADYGDVYVNDAFGSAHRHHTSTAELARYFPGKAATGFLMEKEMQFFSKILSNPKRPFYAIIGGAKISSKIGTLKALLKKVDGLLIGGGMAYTFFKAQGISIGDSIHEDDFLEETREILSTAKTSKVKLLLPQDNVIADKLSADANIKVIDSAKGIPKGFQGVDIGPKTIQQYIETISVGATIFWNGPMGVFEIPEFATGTNAIAHALAKLKATTIVGGGESVAAVKAAGVADSLTHISSGGGASLQYIEHGTLPGIETLSSE